MSGLIDRPVRFGSFELDPRTGELRKAGVRVGLPDQPCQVLRALIDRPGELVTREELRQRLWPADTFVDFEQGLNAAVRRLREALGDSADAPRFVETLPKRGYRFIAPVVALPVEPPPAETAPPEVRPEMQPLREASAPGDAPRPPRRTLPRWALASVAAAGLVAAVSLTTPSLSPSPRSLTLLVLPFENHTGDRDRDYVGHGMADVLRTALGTIDPTRLAVIGRESARRVGTSTEASRIGIERRASHLAGGSILTVSPLRVDVWVMETRTGRQLWARTYEAKDLVALHREFARDTAREVAAGLGVAPSTPRPDRERYSTSDAALDHYLRGREHLAADTRERLEQARVEFERAIAIDHSFALAYSGMADTYIQLGGAGFLPMRQAYASARSYAREALERDDELAEAHTSLASVLADHDWNWTDAEWHYKRAVQSDRNYPTAHFLYSFLLACMGRSDDAVRIASGARDLEPMSTSAWMHLGAVHYFARHYDAAASAYHEVLELAPDFGPAHTMLGRVYSARGWHEKAITELALARARVGDRPDVIAPQAYVLAKAGRVHEAHRKLDELFGINPPPFSVAYVYVGLDRKEEALRWLDRAFEARAWQMALLKVEPAFDDMRSNKRFIALMARVDHAAASGRAQGWNEPRVAASQPSTRPR